MFFPRLRRHAKWMFVFLAVALGGGFVIFGVGAGGTGVGDLFRNGGSSSGVPSVSSATKKTQEHPNDVEARRDLSTALQTDGKTDEAVTAQQRVVVLAPKNIDDLRDLAGLYIAQAAVKQQQAQNLQIATAFAGGASQTFPGQLVSPSSQSLLDNKLGAAVNNQALTEVQRLAGESQTATTEAVGAYQKMVKLQPNDPNLQLELAQAAQQAGDTTAAIAAYKKFLVLAPDDPSASIVKTQLKQLKQSSSSSG